MFNFFRLTGLFLFLLAFCQPVFSQTAALTKDQKALLKEALKVALVTEKNFPQYADLADQKKVIVLDNMISVDDFFKKPVFLTPKDMPKLGKVKLVLMDSVQLQAIKQPQDLLFVRLGQITQPESDYAMVHVFGEWHLGEESRAKGFTFRQAEGYTLLFQKEKGDWKFQKVINRLPNLFKFR